MVRAVLLATAENVDGDYWFSYIDGKDGAGVVSGSSAQAFARIHTEPNGNSAAQSYAVTSSDFSYLTPTGYTTQYNILIPVIPAGKHLRIVLTWNSCPSRADNKNYLSDLDLIWTGENGIMRSSHSYNSNIEMIDVPASEVITGKVYQAKVQLYTKRIPPPGYSINNGIMSFAIAWNWVKDHADHVP